MYTVFCIRTWHSKLLCVCARQISACFRWRWKFLFILRLRGKRNGSRPKFICRETLSNCIYPFQSVSVTVSILTLTFISIDRWYAICFPLKFKSTTGRAKTAIGIIWIVALACGKYFGWLGRLCSRRVLASEYLCPFRMSRSIMSGTLTRLIISTRVGVVEFYHPRPLSLSHIHTFTQLATH